MVKRSHLEITPWERIQQMTEAVDVQELTAEKAMGIMQEVGKIILKEPEMTPASKAAIELLCAVIRFQTKLIVGQDSKDKEANVRLETMANRLQEALAMRRELEMEIEESMLDPVSKLMNQQAFRRYADGFFNYHKENEKPLNFLLVDIDFFKSINDTFGHDAGDAVLKQMGELMATTLRISDFTFQTTRNGISAEKGGVPKTVGARDGGEEFAVMLSETNLEGAKKAAERLRTEVEKTDFVLPDGKTINITICVGVAEADFSKDENFGALRKRTDLALYESKTGGRNLSTLSSHGESGEINFEPIKSDLRKTARRYEKSGETI